MPVAGFAKNDGTSNAGGNGNGNTPPPQAQAAPPAQTSTPPGQSGEPHGNSGSAPGHTSQPAAQGGGQGQAQSQSQSQSNGNSGQSPQTRSSSGFGSGGPQSGPDQGSGTPGTLNSDCTAHKDPADPGSCQEKGRGNSFDRDPYRGPNRGNDCDEGGGNNVRGEVTNPNNADSPDDSDRGQGNNRCAPRTTTQNPPENPPENPPGGPGEQSSPPTPTSSETPPEQQVAGENEARPDDQAPEDNPGQEEQGARDESPGVVPEELRARRQGAAGSLPFTGGHALWLALMGLLMCGLSLLARAGLARR
jgi:hypothetical protein